MSPAGPRDQVVGCVLQPVAAIGSAAVRETGDERHTGEQATLFTFRDG